MTTTAESRLEVRRGADRTFQRIEGVLSRFSFPMAGNFDLTANAHGALMVHNDDIVDPNAGFEPHRHSETEIVTWIVSGQLTHEDSLGNSGMLSAGELQRMSAGTGIRHSERNADSANRLRVVQMWLPPDVSGVAPGYAQADFREALAGGELVTALTGRPDESAAVDIHNRWVALDIARPLPGVPVQVAAAPFHHLYVTRGELELRSGTDNDPVRLVEGDAVRGTEAGPLDVRRSGDDPAEFLVWRMHAHF